MGRKYAFSGYRELTGTDIPDSVTIIGVCEALKNITIPEGVANIGKLAFGDCRHLKSVELPDITLLVPGGTGDAYCCYPAFKGFKKIVEGSFPNFSVSTF
ncbi:MAG: leucine-rich repeat domain-containing protein [Bacteroidales bacterium]|nr:leucine-rich repeat domain-containing protein [Bacteroidales bacterium]